MTELEKLEKVLSSDLVLPQAKKEISEFIDFYYRWSEAPLKSNWGLTVTYAYKQAQ